MSYTRLGSVPRTDLQRDANSADCELYRLIGKIEALYERNREAGSALAPTLNHLRQARGPLRTLMHQEDREATQ